MNRKCYLFISSRSLLLSKFSDISNNSDVLRTMRYASINYRDIDVFLKILLSIFILQLSNDRITRMLFIHYVR